MPDAGCRIAPRTASVCSAVCCRPGHPPSMASSSPPCTEAPAHPATRRPERRPARHRNLRPNTPRRRRCHPRHRLRRPPTSAAAPRRRPRTGHRRLQLRRIDTLVLHTDGVTEARSADGLFGQQRLAGLGSRDAQHSPNTSATRSLPTHGPVTDDLAILTVRLRCPPGRQRARQDSSRPFPGAPNHDRAATQPPTALT
ncbi:SpoIIE family protein phosphatase [Actinoplanes sp. NPDC026670]|uniref:SpoIIE family protein phosphatase n=1 Tax=Actinoplanes sp. NPDC026670 TaxID=3154700 RepID=UPI0033D42954